MDVGISPRVTFIFQLHKESVMRTWCKILLVSCIVLLVLGCNHTQQKAYDKSKSQKQVAQRELTVDLSHVAHMAEQAAIHIDNIGTEPRTIETQASRKLCGAIAETVGPPPTNIDDWREPDDVIEDLRESRLDYDLALSEFEQTEAIYLKASAGWQKRALKAEEVNASLERNIAALKPVVDYLYWGLLIVIIVIAIAIIAYNIIVRRMWKPVQAYVTAGCVAAGGVTVGIVWYQYGRLFISYGIIAIVVVSAYYTVKHYLTKEKYEQLIADIQKFRKSEEDTFDEAMDSIQSKRAKASVASIKAALNL